MYKCIFYTLFCNTTKNPPSAGSLRGVFSNACLNPFLLQRGDGLRHLRLPTQGGHAHHASLPSPNLLTYRLRHAALFKNTLTNNYRPFFERYVFLSVADSLYDILRKFIMPLVPQDANLALRPDGHLEVRAVWEPRKRCLSLNSMGESECD